MLSVPRVSFANFLFLLELLIFEQNSWLYILMFCKAEITRTEWITKSHEAMQLSFIRIDLPLNTKCVYVAHLEM